MDDGIIVTISFHLQPDYRNGWLATWEAVQEQAQRAPGCHWFRLLRNRYDPGHYVAHSEWNSQSDFDSFARESCLVWVTQASEETMLPPKYTFFEPANNDGPLAVPRESLTESPGIG